MKRWMMTGSHAVAPTDYLHSHIVTFRENKATHSHNKTWCFGTHKHTHTHTHTQFSSKSDGQRNDREQKFLCKIQIWKFTTKNNNFIENHFQFVTYWILFDFCSFYLRWIFGTVNMINRWTKMDGGGKSISVFSYTKNRSGWGSTISR